MIRRSHDKVARLGLGQKVTLKHCNFDKLDTVLEEGEIYDGIISNFGGLNCADDLESLAINLAHRVRSGGYIFLCVMGRWVPWEWLYLGSRGEFSRIWQRTFGTCEWRGQMIRYFSPGQIVRMFGSYCELSKVCGLGFLLPPTYAGSIVSRFPVLFQWLNSIEKRIESVPGIPHLSDHFMIILVRK